MIPFIGIYCHCSLITFTVLLIFINLSLNCLFCVIKKLFFLSQLYLSTRRGAWILNRVGDNGIPLDMVYNRLVYLLHAILPVSVTNSLGEKQLNQRFNHALYNLKPKHRYVEFFVFFLDAYC